MGRQLAESLRFPTVVSNDATARDFPSINPTAPAEALKGIYRECRALVEGPNTCPLPGAYDKALDEHRSAERDGTS